ncbi:MAG: PEP-CTERM sorting domain-containing protein [Phycisphaeraceae bacterium]|nr:PEP-CTERM sorting domain-containing protein [Phycisphaeraceae bacterium]
MLKQLTTTLFVLTLAGTTSAATLFSADLQSASPGLNEASLAPNRAISYSATGAVFGTTGGDAGRNVLRTNDADYDEVGFVAEVTVDANLVSQQVFFGLGTGVLGSFGIPDVGQFGAIPADQISTTIPAGTNFLALAENQNVQEFRINNVTQGALQNFGGAASGGTTRLQLVHDANAQTLTYNIDFAFNGTFAADFTTGAVDISGTDLSDGASIFFAGDDGAEFRDFAVVPEPGSLALLAVGGLIIARRRRC